MQRSAYPVNDFAFSKLHERYRKWTGKSFEDRDMFSFGLVDENWNEGYSYMAVCCHDMNKKDEFLHYLKIAVERNPKEARTVLGIYFPEGMRPEEYYDYISKKMNVS